MSADTKGRALITADQDLMANQSHARRELKLEEDLAIWDRINEQLYRERMLRAPRGYNSRGVWLR